MIRHSQPPADFEVTDRDPAYIETVAAHEGLPLIPAAGYLYCIRRVPLIGQPIIMRCRVSS